MKVRIQGGFVVFFNGRQHEILDGGYVVYIVIINLRALRIGVVDDPIKSLIHYGSGASWAMWGYS